MKETYDRLAAGDRIRLKRTLLGLTQDEMAEGSIVHQNIMQTLKEEAAVCP